MLSGIKCKIPVLSANTQIVNPTSGNQYEPWSKVQFECTPGNTFYTDHSEVECQGDGTWDRSLPTCDPQKCKTPPNIEKGRYDNSAGLSEFSIGQIVQYECEYGFMFNPDSGNPVGKVTCLASGEWESNLPECVTIDCGAPPSVLNGVIDARGGNTFLEQVTYSCNPGYELSHDEILECIEDRHWAPEPPTCNAVRCNRPDNILHGFFDGKDNNFIYNDKVTYRCNLGYRLVGESVSSCLQNSSWSGTIPACKPISCGDPGSIDNGRVIGRDYTLNNVIRYECTPGFNLDGATERICRETGKWTPSAPVCVRAECPTPPTIGNGYFKENSYFYQDNITYECEDGFRLIGVSTLTCMTDAQWSTDAPICAIIRCERAPRIANAHYSNPFQLLFFRVGQKVNYECFRGYEMLQSSPNPSGELICLKTGQWESDLPMCEIISCPSPPQLQNGRAMFEDLVYRSIVQYECNDGYSVDGVDLINCQADGLWSDEPPTCVLKECKAPEYLLNGELNYKELTPQSVIRYMCNEGFKLVGQEVRRCQANLTWAGEEPSCEPVDCSHPNDIENGDIIFEDTVYQATVTYSCDRGYNRVGDRTRICGKDEKWSGSAPVCEIVQCDRPSRVISNGRMIGDNFIYGSVITYECDAGYYIDGAFDSRTCLETGEWNRPIIICTAVECPTLSVRNGQLSGNSVFIVNSRTCF